MVRWKVPTFSSVERSKDKTEHQALTIIRTVAGALGRIALKTIQEYMPPFFDDAGATSLEDGQAVLFAHALQYMVLDLRKFPIGTSNKHAI